MSPLQIKMALAYYCSPSPELMFLKDQWESEAAADARIWLQESGLIAWNYVNGGYRGTEKLTAYCLKLCSIPLPVEVTTWEFPDA